MIATNGLVFANLRFGEALRAFKTIGVEAFELPHPIFYTGIFSFSISPSLKDLLEETSVLSSTDIKIVTVNAGNDFLKSDDLSFRKEIEKTKVCIDTAQALGVPLVRVFIGEPKEGMSTEGYFELAHQALAEVCKYAEKTNVLLALENHGRYSNDVKVINAVLARVNSPILNLNIDTGNFYWFGYSLEETENILDSLSSLAVHTHLKNAKAIDRTKPRSIGETETVRLWDGDIDIGRFVSNLMRQGYKGALSPEFEFKGMREMRQVELEEALREDTDRLRKLVATH